MGLLAYWDCGFEYHLRNGCLSVVNVVCGQVEGCAMDVCVMLCVVR